jgi:hypothetical protein
VIELQPATDRILFEKNMPWYTGSLDEAIELYKKRFGCEPVRGWTDGKIIMLDLPEVMNDN